MNAGDLAKSEVRGIWFVTARRYMLEHGGAEWLDAMATRLDRSLRDALLAPDASVWYPERAMQQAVGAMHAVAAGGSDEVFLDVIEECTILGIDHFFRLLMRLGAPTLVLRKAPAMWAHIRRGAGKVAVDADHTGAELRFTEFPYFRDPNYRLLTVGVTRALVTVCKRPRPRVDVTSFDWDRLTLRVTYA
jgi:hypothetical protein